MSLPLWASGIPAFEAEQEYAGGFKALLYESQLFLMYNYFWLRLSEAKPRQVGLWFIFG